MTEHSKQPGNVIEFPVESTLPVIMQFKAQHAPFEWTNEDWARTFAPTIRIASAIVRKTPVGLLEMAGQVEADAEVDLLLCLREAAAHLRAVAELCHVARRRLIHARVTCRQREWIDAETKAKRKR